MTIPAQFIQQIAQFPAPLRELKAGNTIVGIENDGSRGDDDREEQLQWVKVRFHEALSVGFQASTPFTTSPKTSVRRKSRPWNR